MTFREKKLTSVVRPDSQVSTAGLKDPPICVVTGLAAATCDRVFIYIPYQRRRLDIMSDSQA